MSSERHQIYKCEICGLVVEILDSAPGKPVCCGQAMKLQAENNVDASLEKHVPVIAGDAYGVKISVGSAPHPMTPEHYIEWIEVINGSYVNRKYLKPGDAPEAEFYVPMKDNLIVRSYCNLHGLWRGEK